MHTYVRFSFLFFFFGFFLCSYTLHIMSLNGSNVSISRNFDVFSLGFLSVDVCLFSFFLILLLLLRLQDSSHWSHLIFIRSIWQRLDNNQSQRIHWRIHLVSSVKVNDYGNDSYLFRHCHQWKTTTNSNSSNTSSDSIYNGTDSTRWIYVRLFVFSLLKKQNFSNIDWRFVGFIPIN